jgi:excisionase family DNA binding protein
MPRAKFDYSQTRPEDKLLLSTAEVGKILGVNPIVVCEYIRKGSLKAAFIGRSYFIRRADLDGFVAGHIGLKAA